MNKFDEAARKAANDIFNSPRLEVLPTVVALPKIIKCNLTETIAKHYTDLRSTYDKLVELVQRQQKYITVLNRCDTIRSADELVNMKLLNDLLAHPLVVEAMKQEEK
jgi:hypothetical protein